MNIDPSDIEAVKAEVSALQELFYNYEPENELTDNFGWGLGKILLHIENDLQAIIEKAEKEEAKP